MKTILVLFAVGAAGAAGYLIGDEGEAGMPALFVGGVALVALMMWKLIPEDTQPKKVSLRPSDSNRNQATPRGKVLHPGDASRQRDQERILAEKSAVGVRLIDPGKNQIAVIKVLRNHFDIGLKEAKDVVDGAKRGGNPLLVAELDVAQARKLAEDILAAGGEPAFE